MEDMFKTKLIDLVLLGREVTENRKDYWFAEDIAKLAYSTITPYKSLDFYNGIKAVLEYELKNLTWRELIFGISIGSKQSFDNSFDLFGKKEDYVEVIENSIIATCLIHSDSLKEFHTNLAYIVRNHLIVGLGRVIATSNYSTKLNVDNFPLIHADEISKRIWKKH